MHANISGSIEKITQEILAAAEIERKRAENETQERISELQLTAKRDLERIRSQMTEANKSAIEAEVKRVLGKERMDSKMSMLKEKEHAIETVFREVVQRLRSFTQTEKYGKTLTDLATTAGVALEGGDLQISLRKEDASKINKEEIVKRIKEQTHNQSTTLAISLDLLQTEIGGLVVRKEEIFVDNTFEVIIDRRRESLRQLCAEILFSS